MFVLLDQMGLNWIHRDLLKGPEIIQSFLLHKHVALTEHPGVSWEL